jgi:polysaccharide export outer membrane protein
MAHIKWLNRYRIAFFYSVMLMLCASCSYKQNQVLFETAPVTEDNSGVKPPPYEYRIETQDLLQMRNLQNINYVFNIAGGGGSANGGSAIPQTQNYQVENDSTVALPVIGRVKVAGLTKSEATQKIQSLYARSVLKDPIIELKIVSLKVAVFGEVRTPGSFTLTSDKTTLLDVLAQAGGLTEKADEKKIKIVRGGLSNPHVLLFNLNDFRSVSNPAIIMQSEDIIYVAQNKRAIKNEKFQDASTIVQPALLLLNTVLIIFTLSRR